MIVFHDNVAALRACIATLEQQNGPSFEIIVVDNRGEPALSAIRSESKHVLLLSPGGNLGYGAGNNLAASVALGEYLLILNPDVLSRPDFLERMSEAMQAVPNMALVTATLLLPDGRVNAQGNDVTYSGITTCRALGDRRHRTGLFPVPAVSGAAFAIRRRDFQVLGGFDEQFFMYLEDTDLSLRAVLQGGSCWCFGDAVAIHDYRWRFSPGKQRELEKNRLQLLLKTFRRSTLLALSPGLLLVELCTMAYALLRGPAFLWAKVGVYGQLAQGRRGLRQRRSRVQAERLVDDSVLLGRCTWRIPFRQQLGVVPGTTLEWLLAPFFAAPYAAARAHAALVAFEPKQTVVAPQLPPQQTQVFS